VAEDLFRRGICLPSSSSLSVEDQLYVINCVRKTAGASELTHMVQTGCLADAEPERVAGKEADDA
jgi:hypothetical protein